MYNFSPGPATIPPEVYENIQFALKGTPDKFPILEHSHRSQLFLDVVERIKHRLTTLLNVPKTHQVILCHSGTRAQYSAVPMNLSRKRHINNYFCTGYWSNLAVQEGKKHTKINIVCSLDLESHLLQLPAENMWRILPQADYTHYVANETLTGFEFCPLESTETGTAEPIPANDNRNGIPTEARLVSDMTSSLMTRPVDFTEHRLIYAGAQKNFGIAGLVAIFIKNPENICPQRHVPNILNFHTLLQNNSLATTPPMFSWYTCACMLDWIDQKGGVPVMQKRSRQRSSIIYQYIDQSSLFSSPVLTKYRSRLNVFFHLPSSELEMNFLNLAEKEGFFGLRGHPATGGIRASMYNGMPLEGARELSNLMRHFERTSA